MLTTVVILYSASCYNMTLTVASELNVPTTSRIDCNEIRSDVRIQPAAS